MASGLKVIAALGAIAAGAAAIFAFKKHKELENYDYEAYLPVQNFIHRLLQRSYFTKDIFQAVVNISI